MATGPLVTPVLRVEALVKRFGQRVALDGISLAVAPGEFVGLLGPNGAGKTTLASIVAGLLAADSGTVELFGTTLAADRRGVLARLGVVFQSRSLDLEMSVMANLRFHAALFGMGRRAAGARIAELAELLEIGPLLGRPVRTLSGGNHRRIEIARALLNRPRLVLMDEATAGLDPAARPAVVAHARELCRRESTAILWTSHLLDEVEAADRIIILDRGQVRANGTPAAITGRAGVSRLLDAYTLLTGGAERQSEAAQ
jgi:ABC-2 type transport system ATP-binding protein